jgi:hypothetical protein
MDALLMFGRRARCVLFALSCVWAVALAAATPSQTLSEAAFQTRDRAQALALIGEAEREATALAASDAGNREAVLIRAMALGYRAKLNRNRSEALAARKQFEQLAAANPRDPDAAMCVGTWHLDSIVDLGGFTASLAIGARKTVGYEMLDRAVSLGGRRATYPGIAALLRLSIDPTDPRGRTLAEMASAGSIETPLDRIFQRSAAAVLAPLKGGDDAAARKLARQLLPFGKVPH